jgi:hypothetical protein
MVMDATNAMCSTIFNERLFTICDWPENASALLSLAMLPTRTYAGHSDIIELRGKLAITVSG